MSLDRDLMSALPEAPPPRADRRKLAIEAALRRFDGGEAEPARPRTNFVRTPVRALLARPQMAAFATVLLVALVSMPVWLTSFDRREPGKVEELAAPAQSAEPLAPNAIAASPPDAPEVAVPRESEMPSTPALPMVASGEVQNASRIAPAAAAPPPVQFAQTPVPRAKAAQSSADAFQASAGFVAGAPMAQQSTLAQKEEQETDSRFIVVTGSRAERPSALREVGSESLKVSGNSEPTDDAWNACTVLDPRRNLRACRDLLDAGQPGATSRAAAFLGDGLTAAWKGNLDTAIKAFDRAIAIAPDLSFAYLNRGLAYQLKGENDRALTDFSRAIARDPDSASAYYHRSLLRRARGETDRADADAKRARQLDPHNAGVLREP